MAAGGQVFLSTEPQCCINRPPIVSISLYFRNSVIFVDDNIAPSVYKRATLRGNSAIA